jgi:mono/diheme cytochrome c family protein
MADDKNKKPSSDGTVKNAHQNQKHGMQLFIFAMVFVCVFFIYVTFFHHHTSPDYVMNAKEVEQQPAPTQAAAPAAPAAGEAEPWTSTPEKITKGEGIFKTNCALCHGEKGTGDGVAGKALKPPPRNYTEGKWKFGNSTIALFNTISKGSPGTSMAPYEGILKEDERWAVVAYVRTLGKNIVDPSAAEIKAFKEKKK